ncbi:MAG: glycosyltransferase [Alphaproteobacteria bacterium]|nr:glycosyltransferase [Alphaproteobacteria bacterium]
MWNVLHLPSSAVRSRLRRGLGIRSGETELQSSPKSDVRKRPLPILYVINSLDIGGAELHLTRMLQRLDRNEWAPAIYTIVRRGTMADVAERNGVPVYSTSIPDRLRGRDMLSRTARLTLAVFQLVWHLARHKPRLVHFFLPVSYLIGLPATFIAHVLTPFRGALPLRVMSRRSLNRYQLTRPFIRRVERLLHGGCSAVIGNSRAVVGELEAEGVRPDRLRLIYNGIEVTPAEPAATASRRAPLSLPEDAVVITQVANLIPYKGHADLLEAFAKLRSAAASDAVLCLVGRDDGIGPQLVDQARSLGIAEQVKWMGVREDVADILAASDIGVLSSHEEGFSNAILEGMAAGLPMVVTRVGGNPEAVLDGETGFVVEPRDPEGLAQALGRLTDNPDLRRRMGEAGRQRAADHFSLTRCVEDYERLYASLNGSQG